MQELEQEVIRRPSPPRLELLRQWLSQHRMPATAVAIVVGVLLLASGYFAYSAVNQSSQQAALQDRINRLGGIVATPPQRLQEVTKEHERVLEAMPPGNLKETDVYCAVLDLANPDGICGRPPGSMDVQISYRGDSQTQVGGTSYRAMSFTVNVGGPNDLVWGLIKELDRPPERLATLVLGKVSMTAGPITRVSADFVVYTHMP